MSQSSLPRLRQELSLHAGPTQSDGSPSWLLHDPAANRFYQLDWASFEILARWSLGEIGAVRDAVNCETALHVDDDDVLAVSAFLSRHQLVQADSSERNQWLWQLYQGSRPSRAMWLLKNYLFFRIPLIRPEALLARLAPLFAWVFTPGFWWGLGGLALLGLTLVSRRWDEFTHTFSAYTGVSAMLGIGLSLGFAKVLHEMGHALTAYRFGCRVPAMGVAFLVLMPVLYTDTNDAWKLPSRRQRLLIGAAGMLAELMLAAVATLLWALLPDGPLRAGTFLLATTTWLATLAINASPFMRFDGYFLLVDWLGMPNLHQRAFALARWQMRRLLLGLDDPVPEHFPPSRQRGLILFAWATWLYRLVLFLSIALLVYHLFFKALGLFMLAVELGWFIVRPIAGELKVWWQRRAELRWQRETRRSAALLAALALFVAVPWQSDIASPAVLTALHSQGLYAPAPSVVQQVMVRPGQQVRAGQPLLRLQSSALEAQLTLAGAREQALAQQLAQQPFHPELQQLGPVLFKQWQAAAQQVEGLRRQANRLLLTAPFDGRVADVDESVVAGTVIAEGERLLDVIGPDGVKGEAFVDEAALAGLASGDEARFVPDSGERWAVHCRLGQIDRLNLPTLDQPLLASVYGGPIATEQRQQALVPLEAVFRVRLERCERQSAPTRELAGVARLQGPWRSWLQRGVRRALVLFQREAGL